MTGFTPSPAPAQLRDAPALTFGHDAAGRAGVLAHCGEDGCGATLFVVCTPNNRNPKFVAKRLAAKGWTTHRQGATCPGCNRPAATAGTEDHVSRDAIRAQAAMFDLLREHIESDGAVARYSQGWDDERVSRETGLSVEAVREARETLRPGRLADPLVEGIEQAIAAERQAIARDLAEIRQLLQAFEVEAGKRFSELDRRLQDARARRGR